MRVSKELRAAARNYYLTQEATAVSYVGLVCSKYKRFDILLVRFTDTHGRKRSAICTYDGWHGELEDRGREPITEFDWCEREDEDAMVESWRSGANENEEYYFG